MFPSELIALRMWISREGIGEEEGLNCCSVVQKEGQESKPFLHCGASVLVVVKHSEAKTVPK